MIVSHPLSRQLKVGVGIATANRPETIAASVRELELQSRKPDHVVICAPTEADLGGLRESRRGIGIVLQRQGLTVQRNTILNRLIDCDVVVFFDDDFIPSASYLETIEEVFLLRPDAVMLTGNVIADGITGPGISHAEARSVLESTRGRLAAMEGVEEVYNAYGCNMAVRLDPIRKLALRFDEDLPLYGWLEDVDFSRRLAKHGEILRAKAAVGVHLGTKSGRQSGVRLGYSQIANPIYLAKRNIIRHRHALYLILRNVAANACKCVHPEPYVDRSGRLFGNARAVSDLIAGRLHPKRVLELQ